MSRDHAFVVVPFQRIGTHIGPLQAMIFSDGRAARVLAQKLRERFVGIAVLERLIDEDTGDSIDRLLDASGAVPEGLPHAINWTMPLH
jgi:hypothetical protein